MIKVLLIAESTGAARALERNIATMANVSVSATILSEKLVGDWQQKYKQDCIIMTNAAAEQLSKASTAHTLSARQQVVSRTHQGLQLVTIDKVSYFQAEHKYVTAYHASGQLLIEDSLDSLEQEFTPAFLRIHRKLLVAKNKVESLYKDAAGHYLIKLQNVAEPLMVSRRKVAQVRKMLSC
jgi:two-component system response regulator AlgR